MQIFTSGKEISEIQYLDLFKVQLFGTCKWQNIYKRNIQKPQSTTIFSKMTQEDAMCLKTVSERGFKVLFSLTNVRAIQSANLNIRQHIPIFMKWKQKYSFISNNTRVGQILLCTVFRAKILKG